MGGMELLRRTLGMALFGLLTTGVQAQLILNGSLTPADCVQNILLGNSIVATNITFNGQPGTQLNPQIGGFNGTLCNIGMAGGVTWPPAASTTPLVRTIQAARARVGAPTLVIPMCWRSLRSPTRTSWT